MENRDNQDFLLEHMPKVQTYKSKFDSLNGLLNKTTLTGKISSLDIAENLFIFMDETQQKFSELQESLISTLLHENFRKVVMEISTISQVFADIINRTLCERAFNTQLLQKDAGLIRLLSSHETKEESFRNHLRKFIEQYSVYCNAAIFDKEGHLLASANESLRSLDRHELVMKALQNGAFDMVDESGLVGRDGHPMIFFNTIEQHGSGDSAGKTLGAICLVFDFSEELEQVFSMIQGNQLFSTLLLDAHGKVIASSNEMEFPPYTKLSMTNHGQYISVKMRNREYIAATSEAHEAMGYKMNWTTCVLMSFRNAFAQKSKNSIENTNDLPENGSDTAAAEGILEFSDEELEESALMGEELRKIITKAENITEDLGDVVINGEIIASKSHSYSLNPILDNIRVLSEQINNVCIESIRDLQDTVMAATLDTSSFFAYLAGNIMDRNLYERVNDVRWFARSSVLREVMARTSVDYGDSTLTKEIAWLDKLYKVYKGIIVFNKEREIVAVSVDSLRSQLGRRIDSEIMVKVKNSTRGDKYVISDFEKSPYYNNEPTYVLFMPIIKDDDSMEALGGIGLVYDSKVQFPQMIKDALPKAENGEAKANTFGLFADKNQTVIASTNPAIKAGETLEMDERFFKLDGDAELSEVADFRGKPHIIGCRKSQGYREFKTSDGYNNDIYSFIMMEL